MWVPLLTTLTASHHVRMLDAVGDVNKSVATRRHVIARACRASGSTRCIDALDCRAQPDRGGVDRHLDGGALRNRTAWARRTAGDGVSPVGMVGSMRMKWLIKMAIEEPDFSGARAKTGVGMLAAITTDETGIRNCAPGP